MTTAAVLPDRMAAQYDALQRQYILVDRSDRGRMRFTGAKANEVLTGLVTNDILALQPGHGVYAAALTAKGKIVADVRIFADADGYLVDVPPRAKQAWTDLVRKFVNPRLAKYSDESSLSRCIGVFGPSAHHVAAACGHLESSALAALPAYAHTTMSVDGELVRVARVPDLGVEGFDIFVRGDGFVAVWQALAAGGAAAAAPEVCEIARIEAGRPAWGIDIDDTTLAQEANLDELGAISYTKGCYVGQEVVARIHFRGHVNRHLRGLRAVGAEPPVRGSVLVDDAGHDVGDVRSTAVSPRFGGIALGMVRREVAVGTALLARAPAAEGSPADERPVHLAALPFGT